jgi:hypothetical protein
MKKVFCILLVLVSVSLFTACKAQETINQETEPIVESALANEDVKEEDAKDIIVDPYIYTRAEAFLNSIFSTYKMVSFDGFNRMSEELKWLVFEIALCKGIVHEYNWKTDEGLTKEMIEDNIQAVFGPDIISKLDYAYICADYDEEREIYIPWMTGTPPNAFPYVFHSIENVQDNVYKAVVSQIFTDSNISTFDTEGKLIAPDHITQIYANSDSSEKRAEAIEALKAEVLQNPQKYEKMEVILEVDKDHIYLLSARKAE